MTEVNKPLRFGIYGSSSGNISIEAVQVAQTIGKELAVRQHVVVTGACPGVPAAAVHAAAAAGGKTVGYPPAFNAPEVDDDRISLEELTEIQYVPRDFTTANDVKIARKYRNIASVASVDAAIFIAGKIGTLNEFTLAYEFLKPIGAVTGTGGLADWLEELNAKLNKLPAPPIIISPDPMEVIDKLERILKQ